jgi:hypothetical protein
MSESLLPLLTGGLATIAFIAGWLAHRQRHLRLMNRVRVNHERQSGLILARLTDARRQATLLRNEKSLLMRELVHQRARWNRADVPRAPEVEPPALRTSIEVTSDWRPPDDESGFPDTQPWEPGSRSS